MQSPNKPNPKSKAPVDPRLPRDLNRPLNPPAQVSRVRFRQDGVVLAAACFDATIRRWDVSGDSTKELPPLKGHQGWVTGLAYAQERLVSMDSWGRLTCWDEKSEKPIWSVESAHDGWGRCLAVNPEATQVVTSGRDRKLRVWSVADGQRLAETTVDSDPLTVAFTPDGLHLLVGTFHGRVHVIDVTRTTVAHSLEANELFATHRIQEVGGVRTIAFDHSAKRLIVAGAVPASGGFVQATPTLILFDWPGGKRLSVLKGESEKEGYVTDIAWHPTDRYFLATTSGQPGNGKLLLWRPGEDKPFVSISKPNCHSLALQPRGHLLAVAATNANSAGNGRPRNSNGPEDYPSNYSPIHLFEMPQADL